MARTNTLSNFLTDIAAAIKQKKDDQTDIQASEFDTEILALPAQGVYQHKTVPITQNGTHTVIPDSGYDAIDELTINVAVPEKRLQTKNYTFTQNANLQLTPEIGYDGFDQIGLNINVPTGADVVKLFTSEQAMQADPNPQEGDLAVVYRSETQPYRNQSPADKFSFPEGPIVLSEAVTDYIQPYFRQDESYPSWVQFDVTIEPDRAYINWYWSGNQGSVEYESVDGITYTRSENDSGITTVELPCTVQCEFEWDDVVSNFLYSIGVTFEGLFEYNLDVINNNVYTVASLENNVEVDGSNWDYVKPFDYTINLELTSKICNNLETIYGSNYYTYNQAYYDVNNRLILIHYTNQWSPNPLLVYDSDGSTMVINIQTNYMSGNIDVYTVNLSTGELTQINTVTKSSGTHLPFSGTNENYYAYDALPKVKSIPICVYHNGSLMTSGNTMFFQNNQKMTFTGTTILYPEKLREDKYLYAPTQLTLDSAGKLLADQIGYGKTGVVVGDGSIYDNLDSKSIITRVFGIPEEILNNYNTLPSKIVNGYYFNHDLQSDIVLTPYHVYNIDSISSFEEGNMAVRYSRDTGISVTRIGDSGYLKIYYDEYNEVYIIVQVTDTSSALPKAVWVYDISGNLIQNNVASNSISNDTIYRVFYYNNQVYFNGSKALYRMNGTSLVTVCTHNILSNLPSVDYVQGFLYTFYMSASGTTTPIYKIDLSSGVKTTVTSSGKGGAGDDSFIYYVAGTTLYYKKLTDTSFKNVSFSPTGTSFKYWYCEHDGDTMFVINCEDYSSSDLHPFIYKVDYTTNTVTKLIGDSEFSAYSGEMQFDVYNHDLYCLSRHGALSRLNVATKEYTRIGKSTEYIGYSGFIRLKILSNTSFMGVPKFSDYATTGNVSERNSILKLLSLNHQLDKINCVSHNSRLYLLSDVTDEDFNNVVEPDYTQLIARARDNLWAHLNMQGEISAEDDLEEFYAQDPEVLTNNVVRFYLTSGMGTWDVDTQGNCTEVIS